MNHSNVSHEIFNSNSIYLHKKPLINLSIQIYTPPNNKPTTEQTHKRPTFLMRPTMKGHPSPPSNDVHKPIPIPAD